MAEGLSMEDVSGPSTEGLRESLLEDPFFFFFFRPQQRKRYGLERRGGTPTGRKEAPPSRSRPKA